MSPPKHACQVHGVRTPRVCYLVKGHPGRVHVDITDGGLIVWSLPDKESFRNVPLSFGDQRRDAPEALRTDRRCQVAACGLPYRHSGPHGDALGYERTTS